MILTFLRHAQVEKEYIGKYNGHIDIPISQYGREQSKELAKKLSKIKFDKIYCSDLLRAKQTLEIINPTQEAIYSKELREKSWGEDEGKSYDEICIKKKIEYINFEQWISKLDGETIKNYKKRIENYFDNVILKNDCQNILIVTHSGVIKTFISLKYNHTMEDAFKINIPYASYKTFEIN
jgi:alpha-ribazole phosphatase/probable phosphoglycerate mutase